MIEINKLSKEFEKIIDKTMERYQEISASVPDEVEQLRRQKAGAEERLANLYRMVENGVADEFDLARMKDIKEQIRALAEKITKTDIREKISITRDQIKRFWYQMMADLKMQKRPEIIRPLLQKIISDIRIFPDRVIVGIGSASQCQGLDTGSIGAASKPLITISLDRQAA